MRTQRHSDHIKSLTELDVGTKGIISNLRGGHGFKRRLGTRGIRIGKPVRIVAKQFRGPIVVESDGFQITLGRGMARKVLVKVQK